MKFNVITKQMFKLILVVGVIITFNMFITSCDDDDSKDVTNNISGTTWTIQSLDDPDWNGLYDDEDDDYNLIGVSMTFNKNGSVTFSKTVLWSYAKWSLNGEVLKIVVGEEEPDDYLEGKFIVNGNKATYTFNWNDYGGKWSGSEVYTMVLVKK